MAKRKARKGSSGQGGSSLTHSRIHFWLILACLFLILVPLLNKTPDKDVSQQAVSAAQAFLGLVDSGDYGRSWDAASEHLKKTLPKDDWYRQLAEIRAGVGELVERNLDDITRIDAIGDLPPGEYVVVSYDSTFRRRPSVTEKVTLHRIKGGEWQVAGYHLN